MFLPFMVFNFLIELTYLAGKLWSKEYSGFYIWAATNWKPCICSILQWKCSTDNSGHALSWCCASFASLLPYHGREDIPSLCYWGSFLHNELCLSLWRSCSQCLPCSSFSSSCLLFWVFNFLIAFFSLLVFGFLFSSWAFCYSPSLLCLLS